MAQEASNFSKDHKLHGEGPFFPVKMETDLQEGRRGETKNQVLGLGGFFQSFVQEIAGGDRIPQLRGELRRRD